MKDHNKLLDKKKSDFFSKKQSENQNLKRFIELFSITYKSFIGKLKTKSTQIYSHSIDLEKYPILVNSLLIIDDNATVISWNSNATTKFGWEKEEIIGKPISNIITSEENINIVLKNFVRFLKYGEEDYTNYKIESIIKSKNQFETGIVITIIPLITIEKILFCIQVKEKSNVEKNEVFKINQEKNYRSMVSNINIGLLEIDVKGLIVFANEHFSEISGYKNHELIGKNPTSFLVLEVDKSIIDSKILIRNKGISDNYEIKIKNKAGEIRWWSISGGPKYDETGKVIGSVGLHLDITDKKLLTLELERQKLIAEESAKSKEVFLINMSHEIRTPLNSIIGFIRELDRENLDEKQRTYIDYCKLSSYHLMSIINNILDISKIEAKEINLENTSFNFKKKMNAIIDIMQIKAIEKNLKLSLQFSGKIYSVLKGDVMRIEQVIYNIIGNSLKFTTSGSVTVKCEILNENVASQDVFISISDTGIGMEKEFITDIFNKFSQENHAISREFGGTGLGMSISYELIKLMGGKIEIESKKNIGTTVKIYLTLRKGKGVLLENNEKAIKINLKNVSILLIDDNKINRIVAKKSIENYNGRIVESESGFEAIEVLKNTNFDIILMDIIMPGMDGVETTNIIRNELKIKTPIIAFTANAYKSEIDKYLEIGMDDFIIKPYDEAQLIEKIANYTFFEG